MSTRLRRALPYIKDTCLILRILLISCLEPGPPTPSTLELLSWTLFKARPKREKALAIKIAHATFYSGECLLSSGGRSGRWEKEGQVLEAPVGLSSTGKVEGTQDWRLVGSGQSSHQPVPASPRTLHVRPLLELGGGAVSHPPVTEAEGADWSHAESQPGVSFEASYLFSFQK